jgi:hypothetical protein
MLLQSVEWGRCGAVMAGVRRALWLVPDDNVAVKAQGKCKSLKNSVRLADSSGFGDEVAGLLRSDRQCDAAIGLMRGGERRQAGRGVSRERG